MRSQGTGDRPTRRPERSGADTGVVAKRWLVGGGIWVVVSALAFLVLDPILAAFVAIVLATFVVVAALAADWNKHSTFEQRELVRARKRAAKRERTKDVRARDRARWEAHQARKTGKATGSQG
jgi:hypothetical protein